MSEQPHYLKYILSFIIAFRIHGLAETYHCLRIARFSLSQMARRTNACKSIYIEGKNLILIKK